MATDGDVFGDLAAKEKRKLDYQLLMKASKAHARAGQRVSALRGQLRRAETELAERKRELRLAIEAVQGEFPEVLESTAAQPTLPGETL